MTVVDYNECPECGRALGSGDPFAAIKAHQPYCTPRGNIMSAQPLRPVPDTPKRPHPRELTNHPDRRIARAAQKVVDAVATLDEAWEANAAKADLRAKRDRLKKQLAAVEAELRGTPVKPAGRNWKQIRAWASEQGLDCPATGKVPGAVVEAYDQAHG